MNVGAEGIQYSSIRDIQGMINDEKNNSLMTIDILRVAADNVGSDVSGAPPSRTPAHPTNKKGPKKYNFYFEDSESRMNFYTEVSAPSRRTTVI
jgi:hypothetical protein